MLVLVSVFWFFFLRAWTHRFVLDCSLSVVQFRTQLEYDKLTRLIISYRSCRKHFALLDGSETTSVFFGVYGIILADSLWSEPRPYFWSCSPWPEAFEYIHGHETTARAPTGCGLISIVPLFFVVYLSRHRPSAFSNNARTAIKVCWLPSRQSLTCSYNTPPNMFPEESFGCSTSFPYIIKVCARNVLSSLHSCALLCGVAIMLASRNESAVYLPNRLASVH